MFLGTAGRLMNMATRIIIGCFLLALSCFVLVSCGAEGETSTPDATKASEQKPSQETSPAPTPTAGSGLRLPTNSAQKTPTIAIATAAPTLEPRATPPQPTGIKQTLPTPAANATSAATPVLPVPHTDSPTPTPTTPTPPAPPTPAPLRPLTIERVFPSLEFSRLTNLVQPNQGHDMLFVTEQSGRILVFPNQQDSTAATLFLDLSPLVSERNSEEGLLGLAFDPSFEDNGFFYVYYSASNPRRSVLSRFSASENDPNTALVGSELIIMEIPQPAGNHNGGQLAFGPDGYLYVGLGDGSASGDPFNNGQNRTTLLGSILRIDVATASEGERYRVPLDNPLVGVANARPEIWAYGLRNPWRFSFDSQTGAMWAADVGQNSWEEIDLIQKGLNYGWNVMEGAHCFSPRSGCDETGLQLPLAEYGRAEGCSVIGGYVYRGTLLPSLVGAYVFGDFCSGKIWGLRYDGESVTEALLLVDSDLMITSFGVDRTGNLYIVSRNQGLYRLVPKE